MTNERFAVALHELTGQPVRDGFRGPLRAEARLLKEHSRPADGNILLEASLPDLARGLRRLDRGRGEAPR